MVRSLVKESQPFLFGVDMLQAVSMNWEFDFDVFSKWKDGNYLAYGINGNGSDWLGEIILRDGKFYCELEDTFDGNLAVKNPKDFVKAIAYWPKESIRNFIRVEAVKNVLNTFVPDNPR